MKADLLCVARRLALGVCLLTAAGSLGCGGADAPNASDAGGAGDAGGADAANTAIKEVAANTLPIGVKLPGMHDDGRLAIHAPAGWSWMSRRSDYVVRFYETASGNLPLIYVTVEDSPFPDMATATRDNLTEFAAKVAERVEQNPKTPILEPPRPLILGDTPAVRYVTRGRFGALKLDVERQILNVLQDGRFYTIDLLVPNQESMLHHRDAGYAVAASMKFGGPGDAAASATEFGAEPAN